MSTVGLSFGLHSVSAPGQALIPKGPKYPAMGYLCY